MLKPAFLQLYKLLIPNFISTNLPTVPEVGVNEVIEGWAIKFKQTGISIKK